MLFSPNNPKTKGQTLGVSAQVQKDIGKESDLSAEKFNMCYDNNDILRSVFAPPFGGICPLQIFHLFNF